MSSETEAILYRRNTRLYPNWAGVCSTADETCPACHGTGHQEWAAGVSGNCTQCHGFGVRVSDADLVDPIEVHGDVPPVEDAAFVVALTPGLVEDTDWAEREALATAIAEAGAKGLEASWWAFAEQPVTMDANGDVWA